jgi:hypothetical protein
VCPTWAAACALTGGRASTEEAAHNKIAAIAEPARLIRIDMVVLLLFQRSRAETRLMQADAV